MLTDPSLLTVKIITASRYKSERVKRGTQEEVSVELGIHRVTLAKRESKGRISREAWLALCALPEKPV